jgi:hypothetical protein
MFVFVQLSYALMMTCRNTHAFWWDMQVSALKGPTYFLAYTFGICLYDLGNFRIAVEWIKTACFLSKHDLSVVAIRNVIIYILIIFLTTSMLSTFCTISVSAYSSSSNTCFAFASPSHKTVFSYFLNI